MLQGRGKKPVGGVSTLPMEDDEPAAKPRPKVTSAVPAFKPCSFTSNCMQGHVLTLVTGSCQINAKTSCALFPRQTQVSPSHRFAKVFYPGFWFRLTNVKHRQVFCHFDSKRFAFFVPAAAAREQLGRRRRRVHHRLLPGGRRRRCAARQTRRQVSTAPPSRRPDTVGNSACQLWSLGFVKLPRGRQNRLRE